MLQLGVMWFRLFIYLRYNCIDYSTGVETFAQMWYWKLDFLIKTIETSDWPFFVIMVLFFLRPCSNRRTTRQRITRERFGVYYPSVTMYMISRKSRDRTRAVVYPMSNRDRSPEITGTLKFFRCLGKQKCGRTLWYHDPTYSCSDDHKRGRRTVNTP